jgi:LmbE family N-acetylglucosaminyl deacetylase
VADLLGEVPARVLAVYAHPDDADVACGGTLARWSKAGSEVHLVVCTDGGRGSRDPNRDVADLARQRAGELDEAAAAVGLAAHHVLGFPDGELEDSEAFRAELVGWVRRVKPDVICGHDPTAVFFGEHYVNHRDHRIAGWALLDALCPAAGLPHYFPERGPAHQAAAAYLSGTLEPDVWVDVTDTIDVKVAAVQCHRSQFASGDAWVGDVVRQRAEEEGRRAGVLYAEGFRRLLLDMR